MEILTMGNDASGKQHIGRPSTQIASSSGNTNNLNRTPAKFHFGLLDVPLSDVFPPANTGRTMSSSAPSYERKEVGLMPGRHLTNNAKSLVSTEDGVDATAKHRAMAPPGGKRLARTPGEGQKQSNVSPYQRPIRPTAISYMHSGDSGGPSPRHRSAAISMGMEASILEGSATSDEYYEASQSRLVPRKGAGPDLRNEGGGKIDEYLMRLLRTGLMPAGAPSKQKGSMEQNCSYWQGSRLGPLAPGAGIRSSSVKPVLDSNTPISQGLGGGQVPAAREDGGGPLSPAQTMPPSASGAGLEQQAWRLSKSANNQKDSNGKNGQVSLELLVPRVDISEMRAKEDSQQRCTAKRLLGSNGWHDVQRQILWQKHEFELQLHELHRLAELQSRLQGCSEAGLGPGSAHYRCQQDKQETVCRNGANERRESGQPSKDAWWLTPAAWDPSLALGLASWQPHSTACGEAPQCAPEAEKLMSRTTRIALDAQRARRGNKTRLKLNSKVSSPSANETLALDTSSTIPTPPQNDLPSSMAGPAPDRETWFTHMQPYLRPEAPQSKGPALPGSHAVAKHTDPLKGWYQYHFNNEAAHSGEGHGQKSGTRAVQFAGLSLAPPVVGWEDQCQDFFNYSMTGTSDVNEAGQPARQPQPIPSLPRLGALPGGTNPHPKPNISAALSFDTARH